ncbi:hypothetical protein Cni_G26958 [Canna indica]|uniref:Uncharacterized protein n=1 Tax=Canna indica TaxID=4628 RepID=A0AAQ3QRR2_9LILI|nr:hypothetical protein Cni_G26958 [Canna indica]
MESVLVDRSPLGLCRKFSATNRLLISATTDFLPRPQSSLPCCLHVRPPPLLPLPSRNPSPAPSTSKRSRDQHQQNKRKPRSQSVTPTKNPKAKKAIAVSPLECLDFVVESVYSKSPPPSSLPLPTLSLTKPKGEALAEKAGLVVQVKGGGSGDGGGIDAGATDGLRRLLGL